MRSAHPVVVRNASLQDRPRISNLLGQAHWRHFHLDWRDPLDLLASPPNLLGYLEDRLVAHLAAPPDPPGAAWIRSFCVDATLPPLTAWRTLWAEAAAQCLVLGTTRVASLLSGEWMRPLLEEAGFRETNAVIFLEWRGRRLPAPPAFPGSLRALAPPDLARIQHVDTSAFPLLWQNGRESLAAAMRQAVVATGAEVDGSLVAYQLTTASAFGAHLARLAVEPGFQGRGLGAGLVIDLIGQLQRAVTGDPQPQADNVRPDRTSTRVPRDRAALPRVRAAAQQMTAETTSDLTRKLGIRPGLDVCVLAGPADALRVIRQACPRGVRWRRSLGPGRHDLIFFWPSTIAGLAKEFARLQAHLHPDGAIWAVMPKKAFAAQRGIRFSWEEMQAEGLRGDLVDNKDASITSTDYGTRFVIRKDRRGKT
jgi:ribosomal protein S18 acetylase RimI-like enzyme